MGPIKNPFEISLAQRAGPLGPQTAPETFPCPWKPLRVSRCRTLEKGARGESQGGESQGGVKATSVGTRPGGTHASGRSWPRQGPSSMAPRTGAANHPAGGKPRKGARMGQQAPARLGTRKRGRSTNLQAGSPTGPRRRSPNAKGKDVVFFVFVFFCF